MNKIYSLFYISLFVHTMCFAATPPASNDPFAALSKQAEEQYQKANSSGKAATEQAQQQDAKKTAEEPNSKSLFSRIPTSSTDQGKPILAAHKQFSDDWWKKLFENCKGCKSNTRPIQCTKMLDKNPQWKEILELSREARQIVMQRVLDKFEDEPREIAHACNLACAICANGDPDERSEDSHHTALHIAADQKHRALFFLLLEKGANPNLRCQPAHPSSFTPKAWRDDWIKYGGKEPDNDDDDND